MPFLVSRGDAGAPAAGGRARRLAALCLAAVWAAAAPLVAVTPSSGCFSGPASPPTASEQQIQVGSEDRTYYPYIPSGYSRSIPYPLVFAFHGTGDAGTIAFVQGLGINSWGELFCHSYYGNWSNEIPTGSDPGIVICPDALRLQSGPYSGYFTWVHANDDEFFDAMLAQVVSTYCVDLDRIFAVGHSVGGFFANEIACERGDSLRGFVSISGGQQFGSTDDTAQGDCERGKNGKVAALIMHGSADTIVPPSSGISSRDYWRNDNGCGSGAAIPISNACARNGSDTHETYQGCSSTAGNRVEWCLWDGVNHGRMFSIQCSPDGSNADLCGGQDLAPPATWEFFQSLETVSSQSEIFSDGFESGLSPWDGAMGTATTSTALPAEGNAHLLIDFDQVAVVCSDEDEDTVDSNGVPYVLGGSTGCVSVVVVDTPVSASAEFTGGLLVRLDNGTSVASGISVTFGNDPSLVPFAYVQDDLSTPLAEYHASFELHVEDLDLPNNVELDLFQGLDAADRLLFRLVLTHTGTEDRLFLEAFENGGGSDASVESSALGDGYRTVEIAYRQGNGDGFFSLSIDGTAQDSVTGLLNNATPLAAVRLGYVAGARNGTDENLRLDDFQSWTE